MKYYVIAGEASGDLHGSNLIAAIKKNDPEAEFRGWGGEKMARNGTTLVKHYKDLAFMGFLEVVKNLRIILNNIKFCVEDIKEFKPDSIILIDYPGFNLRIAEKIKPLGFKVFYYISPQVWAWKASRVKKIKRFVDRMFVILPFEKDFYKKYNYEVDFVGHPLLDAIENNKTEERAKNEDDHINNLNSKPIIALLPGSRQQEISTMLPIMLKAIEEFTDYQPIVAAVPSIPMSFYKELDSKNIGKYLVGSTYQLLQKSEAALVTSGTATLETALFNIPQVVCYKGNWVSFQIAKRLVDVEYISLVNLILKKEVIKELIQDQLTIKTLRAELKKILKNGSDRNEILKNYENLRTNLGGPGASERTANIINQYLQTLNS